MRCLECSMENKYALWKRLKEKRKYYKHSMGGDIYFGYVKGITLQFEDSAITEAVLVSRGAQIRWEKNLSACPGGWPSACHVVTCSGKMAEPAWSEKHSTWLTFCDPWCKSSMVYLFAAIFPGMNLEFVRWLLLWEDPI